MKLVKNSIKTKLTTYFLLVSIIPITIVSYFAYTNSYKTIKKETFNHLISVSMLKEQEINEWINMHVKTIELIKKSIEKDIITNFKLLKTTGESAERHDNINVIFHDLTRQGSAFFELFILNVDTGEIHLSTDEKQIGKIEKENPYFIEGKKATFIKNIYYSLTSNEPAMVISTPIKDGSGNVMAVLGGRVELERIYEIMEEKAGLGETGEIYLINKLNNIITKSKEEAKKTINSKGINDCLNHNNGTCLADDYRGVPVMCSYRWMSEREMCIMAKINQEEVFTSIYELKHTIALAIILTIVIVVVFASLLSFAITKPMLQLAKGAEIIGKGNLKHKINIKSKDEIGMLADSFNQMTKDIGTVTTSRNDLNKEIKERKKVEKQLQKAYKKLKELDLLKNQFLHTATHELKTPLIPIKSQAQLLLDNSYGHLNKNQKEAIKMIYKNENHMELLVSDLIDISKVRSNKLMLIFEKVDFEELVNDAIKDMKVLSKKKGISIIVKKIPKLPKIPIDSRRIIQTVNNLIHNAFKFTPKGAVHVEIIKTKDNIRMSVRDTGIGMNKKTLEKLFTPFFQANKTLSRKYGGSGLGLAICKGIIKAHGGEIWAKSEGKNKGSTFTFTLPLKKASKVKL